MRLPWARPGIDDTDDGYAVETAVVDRLYDLIVTTPARTIVGVREQLRLAHYCAETWEGDRNEPVVTALRNTIATLERLVGRTGA